MPLRLIKLEYFSRTKLAKIVHDETLKSGPVVSHALDNVCMYFFVSQGFRKTINKCINMCLLVFGVGNPKHLLLS